MTVIFRRATDIRFLFSIIKDTLVIRINYDYHYWWSGNSTAGPILTTGNEGSIYATAGRPTNWTWPGCCSRLSLFSALTKILQYTFIQYSYGVNR